MHTLQEQFRQTQVELDRERTSRKNESSRASAKLAQLENALNAAGQRSQKAKRAERLRIFTTLVVLLAAGGGSIYLTRQNLFLTESLKVWELRARPSAPEPGGNAAQKEPEASLMTSPTMADLESMERSPFSSAMARLDRALTSVPGAPQLILGAVHAAEMAGGSSVCTFEWANGQPSMVYEGNQRGRGLAESLNDCAAAVERFQRESRAKHRRGSDGARGVE